MEWVNNLSSLVYLFKNINFYIFRNVKIKYISDIQIPYYEVTIFINLMYDLLSMISVYVFILSLIYVCKIKNILLRYIIKYDSIGLTFIYWPYMLKRWCTVHQYYKNKYISLLCLITVYGGLSKAIIIQQNYYLLIHYQ